MKRQYFYNFLVLTLISTCFYFKAAAQNVQVEARVDQPTIRIGDQTRLRLVVHQPVKERINFPALTDTVTGKVQIVETPKVDTVFDKDNRNLATVTHSYIITSFDAGTYTIPSFSFGSGAAVLKSNEVTLQVQSVQVDTTKAIFDIKQPLEVKYTFFDWLRDNWVWVLIGLAVVLAIIGTIWYFKKRPKPVVEVKEVKEVIPPHTLALSKLHELRDKKLWQQDAYKQYHIELSDVVREYLEKRYVIKTHEKTSEEIFAALKYMDITEENRNKLRQILLLADLVKFAKERPLPHENEQSIDNAISFVTQTQQANAPVRNEEGGADAQPV